jgi:hypothetical protein
MPLESKYIWTVAMDVESEKEELFNDMYDNEHVPNLLKIQGVTSATRYKIIRSTNGHKPTNFQKYFTVYEMDDENIWGSPEFMKYARDAGEWRKLIRPHTLNRRHILYEKL